VNKDSYNVINFVNLIEIGLYTFLIRHIW
jgi:hypothetical protein